MPSGLQSIKDAFFSKISEQYKDEFRAEVQNINIYRRRVTAISCLILGIVVLIVYLLKFRGLYFEVDNIYYGLLYLIMIFMMAVFLYLFRAVENVGAGYSKSSFNVGILFSCALLLWSAAFTLLDQIESGQIIIYIGAIMLVAATPFYRSFKLLLIYAFVHTLFLILLPYFQESDRLVFANGVNSSTIILVAWLVSSLRFKRQIAEFTANKLIQQKNEELHEINRELERLSRTDVLTETYNRLMLNLKLQEEWNVCKRYQKPISLIMTDIDYFKMYNDHYGHQAGDECLKKVAEVMKSTVRRACEIVTRYGGDEFIILLPYIELDNAIEVAETIRKRVEALEIPHEYSDVADHLTISLGVETAIPSEESSVEQLVQNVDAALYLAKRTRNSTATTIEGVTI